MILDEIKLINFGIYKDTHTIQLTPHSKDKPVILIGGQNGLGKTTLLDAFKLVFFGKLAKCSNRGNRGYYDYLANCINQDTDPKDGTSLELKFRTYIDGDERKYEIRRSWGSNGNGVREYFSVYLNGAYDSVISENWHEHLEELFPADISHLFFFDGEKIEEFAEIEESSNLLETAINSLLGLNVVDQLRADLTTLERKKFKDITNKKERQAIDGLEKELNGILEREAAVKIDKHVLQDEIDELMISLDKMNREYQRQGGKLYEQREQLESDLRAKAKELEEVEQEQITLAAGASPLLLVENLLMDMALQGEKEEEARIQQILQETLVARDQETILYFKEMRVDKVLRDKISQFFEADIVKRQSKTEVERYLGMEESARIELAQVLDGEASLQKYIGRSLCKSDHLLEEILFLERTLEGAPKEEAIAEIVSKRKLILEDIEQAKIKYAALTMEGERIGREKEQKENELRRVLEGNAQLRFAAKDTVRTIEHIGRAGITLAKFRDKMILRHINRIEKLILESFQTLMRKKTLIKDITINPEDFQVELYGTKGKKIAPDRLSAGERQLLATAMLWGISRAASMPLPMIIDTPLGRLDSSHRVKLVENYFPNASHQVLLLSTDEEIVGKYYKKLKPEISRQYLLTYDEKERATSVTEGYFK